MGHSAPLAEPPRPNGQLGWTQGHHPGRPETPNLITPRVRRTGGPPQSAHFATKNL